MYMYMLMYTCMHACRCVCVCTCTHTHTHTHAHTHNHTHTHAHTQDRLIREGVTQLYIIGGDGTHKGANIISQEAVRRKLAMTVSCVPKTIDNDIAFIDKSFGFDTAVSTAVSVINCALIEAQDSQQGVGIVKLMGREAGFVAMMATLASNDVDICLVPELAFDMDKLCVYVGNRLDLHGHCIIVIAEGAGSEHFRHVDLGCDESGNKVLPDVGTWLKAQIHAWWKQRGRTITMKYMDPSYQLRSVIANAADSVYCSDLGSTAVHGAMAGFTGFTAGRINQRYVYIPMSDMCKAPKVRVDPKSRIYNRMRVHTGQPDLVPDGGGQGEHGIKEEGSVLAALDLPAANVICEWPA